MSDNCYDTFWKNGFYIIENVFTPTEIQQLKDEIITYAENKNNICFNQTGYSIVDFVKFHPTLIYSKKTIDNPIIHKHLNNIFKGDNYRFCLSNDIGVDRHGPWHKDVMNNGPPGTYIVSHFTTIDIWNTHEGETQQIVKIAIYLQDHENNNGALEVVPGSHIRRDYNTEGSIYTHPKKGDVIIFDQRITHRGISNKSGEPRILLSFGFGKNNIFTDNFEKGTIIRQDYQHANMRNKGNIF
jgi:hypothetical protein